MAKQTIAGLRRAKATSLFSDSGHLLRELLKALFDPYRPDCITCAVRDQR